MDAMKANLTREALKGFVTFLMAEKERHQQDIDMIVDKLGRVRQRELFTDDEMEAMVRESKRYIVI